MPHGSRTSARSGRSLTASLASHEGGAVAVYAALFAAAAMGAGTVAIDVGRAVVLRAQMQNAADAAAMAAARELDGLPDQFDRATEVAGATVALHASGIPADGPGFAVQGVTFTGATVEVALVAKRVDYVFGGFATVDGSGVAASIGAEAAAEPRPFICNAPPLMICDPSEDPVNGFDLRDPASIGRMVVVKPPNGGGSWAPGNFGLLALPDGSVGANDIHGALAAVELQQCYSLDVETAPGTKFNKVKDGLNARFDASSPNKAPNVNAYPRDANIPADGSRQFGNGDWGAAAYWQGRWGETLAAAGLGADATRFQAYLRELGETFAASGKQTIWPVEEGQALPPGHALVEPAAPKAAPLSPHAANGPARRLLKVAVLRCVAEGVRGHHSYPTHGNYVEVFVTEPVGDPPAGGLFGELVRPLTPGVDPDFHANVRLVR